MLKHLLLSAAAVGLTATASFGQTNSNTSSTVNYGNLRQTQILGGRNITVAQRIDREGAPYALTGRNSVAPRRYHITVQREGLRPVMRTSIDRDR